MVTCCGCGDSFAATDGGLMITPVIGVASPKSGRAIPKKSTFPDGAEKKFLCYKCSHSFEVGRVLGFYDTGYDFPSEKEVQPATMPGMRSTYPPGSALPQD